MDRRCTGNVCLAMAGARSVNLDLPIATILMNPRHEWLAITRDSRVRLAREIDVNWKEFTSDNYLFSHCSIVASVVAKKDGHTIIPACVELVNNNGNAWTNEILMATFRSFVGGENYLEHVQVPELSKGKILDAVLRPVEYKDSKGRKADIYFCDILVATSRQHDDLVKHIASGKLTTMSMGCLADYVTCSKCGKVMGDNETNCHCLDHELMNHYEDDDGDESIVAELCGRVIKKNGKWVGDSKSCKFIEASWVDKPAFYGAVLNHYLNEVPSDTKKVLSFSDAKLAETMDDLFKLRVADRAGMLVLRVARAEMMRRRREAMIERLIR